MMVTTYNKPSDSSSFEIKTPFPKATAEVSQRILVGRGVESGQQNHSVRVITVNSV